MCRASGHAAPAELAPLPPRAEWASWWRLAPRRYGEGEAAAAGPARGVEAAGGVALEARSAFPAELAEEMAGNAPSRPPQKP